MALWEMEPDQWFRMWTTIGQGVAGGLTTLAGGYAGYRFARRGDRHKREVELVETWRNQCAELVKDLNKANDALARIRHEHSTSWITGIRDDEQHIARWISDRLIQIQQGWLESFHLHTPAQGSPALVIALKPFASLAEQMPSLAQDDWDGFTTMTKETRETIALAAAWISNGTPKPRKTKRSIEATKQRIVAITGFDPTIAP